MSALFEAQHPSELPTLQVHLLGPPEVRWDGRPLPISRRQARGLLYRLAVRLQPVPREQLCFLFWSDIPETTARRHLTHLLTHLRRALPGPELLTVTGEHVALDALRVWSDVAAFERLCANLTLLPSRLSSTPSQPSPYQGEGRVGVGEGAKGVRGEVLQQAVGLYRGPFLAGFSLPECPEFEAWAELERRAGEALYLKALTALVENLTARGELDAAITGVGRPTGRAAGQSLCQSAARCQDRRVARGQLLETDGHRQR